MLHVSGAFCAAVTALGSRCTAQAGWCQALSGSPVTSPVKGLPFRAQMELWFFKKNLPGGVAGDILQ